MITDNFIHELEEIVGKTHVSVSRTTTELYSYDASLGKGKPGVVVFPADTDETARVARTAHRQGVTFLPRGFGTNLSGGTIVPEDGLIIVLSRLNRILGIYPESRYAVIQSGVTNIELQDALAPLGFFYAPDPASQKVSTIGGNAAENSGGPRCLKYGVTTNHILGLEMVLPDGEVVRAGGAALDPAGYDLRGVMVGSEGTFGITTQLTVRILPLAEKVITMLAVYDKIADAARSVCEIISAGMVPNTLEMLDAMIIDAVEDSFSCGYPRDAAAVLIIEVEGPTAGLKDQAERIKQICMQTNCRDIKEAKDEAERDLLWQGRRGAFGAVARLAPNYLVNDATVPRTKLPEALDQVAQIAGKWGFKVGNVFHAGDGNLHPLLLFDSRNAKQLHEVEQAGWEIMQACVNLGGTISGEHGIGLEKRSAMRMIYTEDDFDTQRKIKHSFDPENILNPGKIIPPSGNGDHPDETFPAPVLARGQSIFDSKASAAAIIESIKEAAAQKRAVMPVGRETLSHFGNLPDRPTRPIDSMALTEVIEYDVPNQLITVGAGMSLDALRQTLKANNQWLPLRPWAGATVGSLAALGACGPERMTYGAPRDLLLGLRFIDSKGRLILAGGRVVKDVAGYDMTRLMTGSAGTLGFITETTWRLLTIPERCAALTAEGSLAECAAAARGIIQSDFSPIYVAAAPAGHSSVELGADHFEIVIGFEGFSKTVDYQLDKCGSFLEKGNLHTLKQDDYPLIEGRFSEIYEGFASLPFIYRADFPPDRVAEFTRALDGSLSVAKVFLDFGCGRFHAGLNDLGDDQWQHICDLVVGHDGHGMLEKAPDDFKKSHDVFGTPRHEWKIVHRIKKALDPDNIFCPGCLPGKV